MESFVQNTKVKEEFVKIPTEFSKLPKDSTKIPEEFNKIPHNFTRVPDTLRQGYYSIEPHRVETEDGYILTLYRITKDKNGYGNDNVVKNDSDSVSVISAEKPKKKSVLILHGFLCSGDNWMLNSPEKTLPYMLLEQGFDCWIGNFRGTLQSRGHVSLERGSRKYWDFSFHEMGLFDLPAMIDHILKVTGNSSLLYVGHTGHSMGCTTFCILISERPEYRKKVELMVALAPALFISNTRNRIVKYVMMPLQRISVAKSRFLYRRGTSDLTVMDRIKKICPSNRNPEKLAKWIAKKTIYKIGIFSKNQIEENRFIPIIDAFPAPTSMKVFAHGTQVRYSKKIRQFDYGRSGNMKKYGQSKPPNYNLDKLDVPIVTFGSENDSLCVPKDVLKTEQQFPNLIHSYKLGANDPPIGHGDFLLGKDAATVIYDKIINLFQKLDVNS